MDSSKQYNLSVFCKIKLNNLQSNDPRSKTHEKRSISPIRSKSPIKQTGDQQMHNIFTPNSENETPKIVVASENPIKQKFINSYFRTERDLFNYRNTILKNAKIFNYDGVFDQSYRFHKFCCEYL